MTTLMLMRDDCLTALTRADWIENGRASQAIEFEDDFMLVIVALALMSDYVIVEGDFSYPAVAMVSDWNDPRVIRIFGREAVEQLTGFLADLPVPAQKGTRA